ncbi:SH3 domain-containing protein [Salinicola aestuarinus]|uniref:SH3 domain-containing protein n=1 Tax=Salinicola aestuarinus TaxID=1949082 RepID=UPI000DA1A808|nr:SH3 domain-containing protein [Salinicola aestuarinus]
MSADSIVRQSLFTLAATALGFLLLTSRAEAQVVRALDVTSHTLIHEQLSGRETDHFRLKGREGQTLSVDLEADNGGAYFNIWPEAADTALFAGMQEGNVADVHLPADGDYRIDVFLVRAAARRDEKARYSLAVALGPPDFADGLAGGPDAWRVTLADSEGRLNVRQGPGRRYPSVGVLANGETLENQGCRLSGEQRWCLIRAANTGQRGWVAGHYLSEAPPIQHPTAPLPARADGSRPFDAMGELDCRFESEWARCPFGVIRDGPGNAGVWITLPNGETRHVLFEDSTVVAVSGGEPSDYQAMQSDDDHIIRHGDERYRIPFAVVDGG